MSVHQVVLTISQLMWCRDMDACLEGDHDHFAALQEFELTNFDVILTNFFTYLLINCFLCPDYLVKKLARQGSLGLYTAL